MAGTEQSQHTDEALLHQLGYRQELNRRISGFTNFALSFTVISILAGTLTSYYIGFANGGPIMMSWGWPFVSLMCVVVALAMAELASAMPTAGGLYYWSSKLGTPAWGWFTGWTNLIGLTIGTAAVGYGLATFATALGNLWFPSTVTTTPTTIFIFYAVFLLLAGVINMYGISPVRIINNLSAWWHVVGTIIAAIVLIIVPTHHQSVAFVFTKTINASGFGGDGFRSLVFWFVIGIGLLQAQYTIGGYDASVHVSEETHNASRKAARGVWTSVAWSGVFGWILLLAVTFAIPDVAGTLKAGAFDVQYIWQQSLGNAWAEFLLFVVVAAQFFCDNADVTASSRILWALSRDKAVPFHNQVRKLNRWGAPAVAVWTIVIFDILWMVPTFWNATIGYLVATSISVIALYGAYAMPIALRLRQGSRFQAGDWNLGKHYKWLGGLALVWITIITILFIMPVTPDGIPFRAGFSWDVFNYAPLTMVSFLVLVGGWWLLSARKWFRGPVAQGTFEELEALDRADGSALVTVTDTGDTARAEDPEPGAGQ